jgi:nucleotide-binding universal stress UspA family protein
MLCVTDLSQRSRRSVTRAVLLANQSDAALMLLHVISPDEPSGSLVSASEKIELQLRSIRPAARRTPGILLQSGEFMPTIARAVDQAGADILVMGSQRSRPYVPLIAATTRELAERVRLPVMIVKRDSPAPYESVLIATEQSAGFGHVLRVVDSLRLLESESVLLIHGFESPYRGPKYASGFDRQASRRNREHWNLAARQQVVESLDAAGIANESFRFVFAQSRSIRELQKEVRKASPDLLVIATRDLAVLERVMRGSAGNDSLRSHECDVMVAPMF